MTLEHVRLAATRGVPDELRARVWALLLAIQAPDMPTEALLGPTRAAAYLSLNREHCEHQRVKLYIHAVTPVCLSMLLLADH